VDPLLQAIVLTAIVIGFAMTAFLLVLVYRTYRVTKEANIDVLTRTNAHNNGNRIGRTNKLLFIFILLSS
jgi:multicomponent Na+:H+ antiporter subunit C